MSPPFHAQYSTPGGGQQQRGEVNKVEETAVMRALKNEQARMEAMKIIERLDEIGGTDAILRLAGYILTAPAEQRIEKKSA
mgnify:CR=1 FL=1